MRKTFLVVFAALCIAAGYAGVARADVGSAATATPWVYPDGAGSPEVVSQWEHAGTQDVLDLQKNVPTDAQFASGATVNGFAGDPLFQLSFDYRGYCNNGSPRINIYEGDTTAFFGCAFGVHTALADGWTHVEFQCGDPGSSDFLCFYIGEFELPTLHFIDGADIVQDEGFAQSELRNVTVDDVVLGPPTAPTPNVDTSRAGYCASKIVKRPGQDDGLYLDLLRGQNTSSDWAFANAVPAFELQPSGALTCLLPAGYKTTGQVDGIYPLARLS